MKRWIQYRFIQTDEKQEMALSDGRFFEFNDNLSGRKIMNSGETKAEVSICEKKLANIREIQISNEVRYKEIKEKGIRLENKLQRLFARAALGEISLSQVQQARQKLNELKGKLKEIAILLKGMKLEEPQYIERISQGRKRIIDSDRWKAEFNRKLGKHKCELR